jgi:hypothetical protein
VNPKKTIYTGICPIEGAVQETATQESYCFCDQSNDCAPGNDVTSCPFEFDGKRISLHKSVGKNVCKVFSFNTEHLNLPFNMQFARGEKHKLVK